ncbi:unnamed protein product [Rhizophagus irregularis]|nr:unnamed protein product [Rhizophagus irregularis]CAB5374116.1 unnamed protein product [Rhizophagus irregularis]
MSKKIIGHCGHISNWIFNWISKCSIGQMVQHCTDDSLKKLFSIVKVNNTLTCNSPIEIPYYSSKLFKESLYFNCGAECKEKNNYGEYFPYCEDCSASVKNKKRRSKENKFVKSSRCKNV